MLIDGEKYACEACVRGHRVSNCNHYERPLTHINKKGRPVSQCPHCRGLRKARSSHVKCECGDRHKAGSVSPTKRGDQKCTCGQGQRCTCAIKKEHLAPINELKKPAGLQRSRSHTDAHKPRMSPMHPESPYGDHPLTVFHNGHHKPVHHLNHAAHDLGMPYKIPRPHSIHGNSSLANASTDSLPLLSGIGGAAYPYEYMAQEDAFHHSAHNSPALKPKVDLLNQLPQLDLSYTALNTDISSITSSPHPEEFQPAYNDGMGYFSGVEQSASLSAMSGGPVDLGLDLPGSFGNEYSQAVYSNFENMPTSHPTLPSSSSGEVSEAEDYINASVHSPAVYANSPYLSPQDAGLGFNVNVSSDSLGNLTPPSSMPTSSGNLNGTAMDQLVGSGVGSPIPQLSPEHEHHFTVQDAQKRAHPGFMGSREASRMPSPPQFRPTSDPSWASPFPDEGFMPNDRFQAQAAWGQ